MKYTLKVEIDLALPKVVELFEDPENWSKWRDGFICFEALTGTPGEEGSETKLMNKVGGSETEMTERVEVKQLPEEMRVSTKLLVIGWVHGTESPTAFAN